MFLPGCGFRFGGGAIGEQPSQHPSRYFLLQLVNVGMKEQMHLILLFAVGFGVSLILRLFWFFFFTVATYRLCGKLFFLWHSDWLACAVSFPLLAEPVRCVFAICVVCGMIWKNAAFLPIFLPSFSSPRKRLCSIGFAQFRSGTCALTLPLYASFSIALRF